MMSSGFFITLEGCEGCGKSTQAKLLFTWLKARKVPVILTQEPGGTPLGEKIRDILKIKRNFDISPLAELFLFSASRSQLIEDVIRPALIGGKVVICDRFTDSTMVYQGYGRGLNQQTIETANKLSTGKIHPDLTILLDLEPGLGLGRKRYSSEDRFETEDISFHNTIRDSYLSLAKHNADRWFVVKSTQSIEQVQQVIREHIVHLIKDKYPSIVAT